MDWKSVEEKIVLDDQRKWDRKVSGTELRVSELGALQLLNGHAEGPGFSLSDTATSQLCHKLEIPVKYYRRLPNEMKATVANYDRPVAYGAAASPRDSQRPAEARSLDQDYYARAAGERRASRRQRRAETMSHAPATSKPMTPLATRASFSGSRKMTR